MVTYANQEVLDFYKQMPFNYSSDIFTAASKIISDKEDILKYYVPVSEEVLLADDTKVLEIGCGTGWLSSLIANYYGCSVTGIDFNPVAIDQALKLKSSLGIDSNNLDFKVADLFIYEAPPFDVVVSHGVLHHTNNCLEGIRKACSLTKKNGHIVIGLYNYYGRKPFLDYFKSLKEQNYKEDELFEIYRKLDNRHNDDLILARSWFNDQVLHPCETQHTLSDVASVFTECGIKLTATSFDNYSGKNESDMDLLFEKERQMYAEGKKAINEGRYYTGYFVVKGEKI